MIGRLEDVWRAINPERLRRSLLDMLDIYSPSGKEEDIQLYLEETLSRSGFRVERQPVEHDRYNLRVTMGADEPLLYLVGHVDTVPAWDLDEFGPREEDDIIRGLGSADMKGGCAAMLEAWLALGDVLGPDELPSLGLLLVVGEEENGDGSTAFLEQYRPAWVVIGEPTGLAPCFSHYGYLEAGFVTRGRRSHSSLPELGHNAVESMLRLLLHLGTSPLFDRDRGEIVTSIRELSSSRAGFVVPDRCEAWIDLHLPPGMDPVILQESIRSIAADAGRVIPELDVELSFDFASHGYDLGSSSRPAGLLQKIYTRLGRKSDLDVFRSHSDGNIFHAAGSRPIILGPGSLDCAHTPDEHVVFGEVIEAARIYAALGLVMDDSRQRELKR
jgi:acetylornithine deacetylase